MLQLVDVGAENFRNRNDRLVVVHQRLAQLIVAERHIAQLKDTRNNLPQLVLLIIRYLDRLECTHHRAVICNIVEMLIARAFRFVLKEKNVIDKECYHSTGFTYAKA